MNPGSVDPQAPGWYPDPADAQRMRRWDGNRWTGESRSVPPWAPGGAAPPRARRRVPRHWLVFGSVAAFLFLAASFKAFTARPGLPPRTVQDAAFIASANDACRVDMARLKAERPKPGSPEGKNPGTEEKVAAQVEDAANRLHAVAERLRDLAVAPADRADVDGWLAEWDRYTDLGHQYAEAVRAKSPRQTAIAEEGATSGQRATLFAQANKLDACTLA